MCWLSCIRMHRSAASAISVICLRLRTNCIEGLRQGHGDCPQALPNIKEGFFQLAQSREIASDGAEDAAADAPVPDGGAEDPAAADGDAATGRSAPAEAQDCIDVDAVPGSATAQKEVAGVNTHFLDSAAIAGLRQTLPVRVLVAAAARLAMSISPT